MSFFSSPWTVDALMGWLNDRFGFRIPTIPLPASWKGTLERLWTMSVSGSPPDPDAPLPWRFDVEGRWQIFASCPATLDELRIVVWDQTATSPAPPGSPPTAPSLVPSKAAPRRARATADGAGSTARTERKTRKRRTP